LCPHPISEHVLWPPDTICDGWMHCRVPGCTTCWHDWPRLRSGPDLAECPACEAQQIIARNTYSDQWTGWLNRHGVATGTNSQYGAGLGTGAFIQAAAGTFAGPAGASEGVAAEAASGADNVVNGARLAQQLTRQEASSVFTRSGGLQQEVIDQSHEIINGARLGNKGLVNELTSDGSSISTGASIQRLRSEALRARSRFTSTTIR
jgi:hypothetical protein